MMDLHEGKNRVDEGEINIYDIWKNIVKRKFLILGVLIIALILGAIVNLFSPKIYRGEAVLKIQPTQLISTKELFEIIGKFDREKVAIISPENLTIINSVKIIQIPGSTDKFKVSIELTERDHFQGIVRAFVEYLNNIPFIKRTVDQSREQLLKKLEDVDVVMNKSQQDAESFKKMMVREKLNPIGFNPVQFYKMLSDLEIEKIVLKQSMSNLTGVELISQLAISLNPVKPRPVLNMTIAGITGLIVGLFLAVFLNYLENLKRSSNSVGKKPNQV